MFLSTDVDMEVFLTEENHHDHGELVTQNLKLKYVNLIPFLPKNGKYRVKFKTCNLYSR